MTVVIIAVLIHHQLKDKLYNNSQQDSQTSDLQRSELYRLDETDSHKDTNYIVDDHIVATLVPSRQHTTTDQ